MQVWARRKAVSMGAMQAFRLLGTQCRTSLRGPVGPARARAGERGGADDLRPSPVCAASFTASRLNSTPCVLLPLAHLRYHHRIYRKCPESRGKLNLYLAINKD